MSDKPARFGETPFVTIAVPTLNEENHIAECLTGLLWQDYLGEIEILVVDGGSTDRTRELVAEIMKRNGTIRIIDNPQRLQSAACNRAAQMASDQSRILIRADAHSRYPRNFISLCVKALQFDSITSVVVSMQAVGRTPLQRAIAAVQNSWVGNGGAAHRCDGRSGFVDHGHHAAFDLAFFRQVGGYDERFTHNEDAELDHRMLAAGGKIWMCRGASILYFPRSEWGQLARQYFNHGKGRARMLRKHHLRPRARQMAPLVLLLGSVAGIALAPLSPSFCLLPLSYALLCCAIGVLAAIRTGDPCLISSGPIAMTMHMSWAVGVLMNLARMRKDDNTLPVSFLPSGMEANH